MAATENRVSSAERAIDAPVDRIFEAIADPARQPEWDGNDNLAHAVTGQRVRGVGDMFSMTLTRGSVRENHIVEFEEGRRIAWKPAEPGRPPVGHLWRWELEPLADGRTLVRHTYDWTDLHDQSRIPKARATTTERLAASIDRLAALLEHPLAGAAPVAFVPSTDLDRSKAFFAEVLGLALVEQSPFACVLAANGTTVRVTQVGPYVAASHTVLGWVVVDIAVTAAALTERGVHFVRYDGMPQDELGVWTTPGGDRVAWFRDPDGNVLSITEHALHR